MNIPEDRKYTKDHEWIKAVGNKYVVGITEFAQAELGELVFVELPEQGTSVDKSATLCVVESTKAASDVYAPVKGIIAERNEKLLDEPVLVNSDPYESGWLVSLTDVVEADMGGLLSAQEYKALLES
jgi:glycine cleavage system H protein